MCISPVFSCRITNIYYAYKNIAILNTRKLNFEEALIIILISALLKI